MNKFIGKNISGQSLFEVIVALALIGIVLTGIVAISTSSIRNSSFSNNNAQASRYNQEAMEWLRRERDASWSAFLTNFSPTEGTSLYCLSNLTTLPPSVGSCGATVISGTMFIRELRTTRAVGVTNIVDATVTVSWTDSQGPHSVVNSTRFTNWRR